MNNMKNSVRINESELREMVRGAITEAVGGMSSVAIARGVIRQLDNKYFSQITGLIAQYIEEYLRRVKPGMSQDEIDDKINLWANSWWSDLTENLVNELT